MLKRFAAALLALFAVPAAAQTPTDPAEMFGVRESIESISLSPSGNRIAYVAPSPGQGSRLFVVDLASGESRQTTAVDGRTQRLGGCNWVSEERLVCLVFGLTNAPGEVVAVSRMVALDASGGNIRVLGQTDTPYQRFVNLWGGQVIDWLPGQENEVLLGQYFIPERREGSNIERRERGFGVVRINTRTGGTRRIEPGRLNAAEYISDGRGNIRIMGMQPPVGETGMAGPVINYMYRRTGSSEWLPLGSYNILTREGPNPYGVDPALDVAYVLEKTNGRIAVFRMALDGSGRREQVAAHDRVDAAGLIRIGRAGRVVGASFYTDTRETVYFDPAIRSLADRLSRALPGLPLVNVIDASQDESRLLIRAGSDTDPGRYYIYEAATRRLNEIMLSRPQLEGARLAEMRAITYPAADGTMVPGYLTLPPGSNGRGLPAIVLPHGGPSARDVWGFDWLVQFYANRGYAVLQPNFRGSAGYGDEWLRQNGFQSWRIAIGDVSDAGRWLVSQGIADPARLAVVGWSYGGYAALQSAVVNPDLFRAVVAIAPVTDLNLLREESRYWSNFRLVRDFIGTGSHIREGSPAQNASAIRVPVLMFHGDLDRNVGILQSRTMNDRLRDAGRQTELVTFPGLDHYIEDSAARAQMLRQSDAFLRRALNIPQ